MVANQPHYLLFSETGECDEDSYSGRWHIHLESLDGGAILEESDEEPGVHGERLELIAVIRGLEALDQPSRVTLVTSSRQVSRGFRFGLAEWRNNGWSWERFGRRVPIKNGDLWRRIDGALRFHRVECRTWRADAALSSATSETACNTPENVDQPVLAKTLSGATIVARQFRSWVDGVMSLTQLSHSPT